MWMQGKLPTRLVLAVVALGLAIGPSREASAQLRGVRYCEVIAAYLRDGALVADVWNSLPAGDPCLAEEWEALDAEAIRSELGAVAVVLNGPRFWVLDLILSAIPPGELHAFGEVDMRLSATVTFPGGGDEPYTEHSVTRDTQFLFRAGGEVYELVDPDGRIYVMQSYSQAVDPSLTAADLPELGSRLVLPGGWDFRVRVPDADYVVEDQSGIATVVQDELQNTYQYFGFQQYPTGRRLVVRQKRNSTSQRLELLARDEAIRPHPTCEIDGDLVIEARGASAPPRRIPLEASGWRAIRQSEPERGCRYDGGAVVRHLRLKAGKLRLSAHADDLDVPLTDDPTPIEVRVHHGERNYCFSFGGKVKRGSNRLVARSAPSAESCPATPLGP